MAAPVPYYLITSCCSQATMSGLFHIPGLGTVPNGVYEYVGPPFTEPTTGMIFDQNSCYTIVFQGTNTTMYPPAFNSGALSLTASNDCDDSDCAPCGSKLPAFSIFNCCDSANVINLNIDPSTCTITDGVWVYDGPGFIEPISGFTFTTNDCYNVTAIPDGTYEVGPDCTDFTITIYLTCQTAASDAACPACALALEFLIFTSCCDATQILFKGPYPTSDYFGVREYLGLPIDGLENICYSIEVGVVGDLLVPDLAAYNLLPDPPIYTEGLTFSTLSAIYTDCTFYVDECPSCIKQCYTLYDCDGNFFNTTIDLSAYLNTFITIIQIGVPSGPYYVLENNSGTCNNAVNTFTVSPIVPTPCDCICYSVIATAKNCVYVDCDGNLVNTGVLVGTLIEFCSLVYPFIQGAAFGIPIDIVSNGLCIDGECPVLCYVLEDCDNILPNIYTTKVSLGIYAIIGAVVIIEGYPDTCWEVADTVVCDCAIDVTVFQYFLDCPTCKGISKYKLTNCDSPTTIIYTSSNLSAYVNQVIVREDCPGCWLVQEVDKIPSDVIITVAASYINCVECARTYYLLEDCSGLLPDAITYTDLSAYVGNVIKLEYCPETCWEVSVTLDSTNAGIAVFIDQEYTDCDTCLDTLPCICTTVRNDDESTVSNIYRYLDCDHNVQTFTLAFGETSEKFCMVAWQFYHPATDYIETFGDCALDTLVWTCPAPIYPRRFVRPGYYVPTCSIEKFEKITCKAAEAMYKKVLEQRYGISNCCPDDDNKWLIKKELIDLAGLVDPNYVCTPIQSCCNDAPNCGCTPLKTCNS